jgi:hypothetical protein
MNPDDVVEFLDWLEDQFPVQFHFRDKARLAYDFTEQRSYRIHDEYEQRIKAAKRTYEMREQ